MNRRNTRQREIIRAVLAQADRPLSPAELLARASGQLPNLGIATIYRTLRLLTEEGWLAPIELPGEATRYELAGKGHHHHFRCRRCRRIFELAGCVLRHRPPTPPGFAVESHEVILHGLCAHCAPSATC